MDEAKAEFGLSLEVCALGNLLWRRLGVRMRESGLADVTAMHAMVIGYLADHGETYQRDLETEFQVNRSTITKIVQVMERRGYIRRESVPRDRRLKRLVLTELGVDLKDRLQRCVEETNREFMEVLPPEEGEALLASLRKIREKLE